MVEILDQAATRRFIPCTARILRANSRAAEIDVVSIEAWPARSLTTSRPVGKIRANSATQPCCLGFDLAAMFFALVMVYDSDPFGTV